MIKEILLVRGFGSRITNPDQQRDYKYGLTEEDQTNNHY